MWSIASTLISLSGDVHTNPGLQPMTNTTLKCIVLNAQSLKAIDTIDNKILDLQKIVYSTLPHVISICETWLIPEIQDSDILSPDLYNIIRKDRLSKGGGVLTAVAKSLYSKERPELATPFSENNEIAVTEIRPNNNSKIL